MLKFRGLISTSIFASLAVFPGLAVAQDAAADQAAVLAALEEALPGRLLHNPLLLDWEIGGNDMKTRIVDAEALTSGNAIRVRVTKAQTNPWDSRLFFSIPQAVEAGDKVQIYYWVRTDKAAKGKDSADINLFLGRNSEPYDFILTERLYPGDDWQLENVTGTANGDFEAGSLKLEYQLGRSAQSVEFGPVYVSVLDAEN